MLAVTTKPVGNCASFVAEVTALLVGHWWGAVLKYDGMGNVKNVWWADYA